MRFEPDALIDRDIFGQRNGDVHVNDGHDMLIHGHICPVEGTGDIILVGFKHGPDERVIPAKRDIAFLSIRQGAPDRRRDFHRGIVQLQRAVDFEIIDLRVAQIQAAAVHDDLAAILNINGPGLDAALHCQGDTVRDGENGALRVQVQVVGYGDASFNGKLAQIPHAQMICGVSIAGGLKCLKQAAAAVKDPVVVFLMAGQLTEALNAALRSLFILHVIDINHAGPDQLTAVFDNDSGELADRVALSVLLRTQLDPVVVDELTVDRQRRILNARIAHADSGALGDRESALASPGAVHVQLGVVPESVQIAVKRCGITHVDSADEGFRQR